MHTSAKYFAEIDGLARNTTRHAMHPRVTPRTSHQLSLRRVKLHGEDQSCIKVPLLRWIRAKSLSEFCDSRGSNVLRTKDRNFNFFKLNLYHKKLQRH